MSIHQLLIGIALVLTVISFIKPSWQLLGVAVLLVCVDLLVSGK